MKTSFRFIMMSGAMLVCLSMCLTSCEGTLDDVFGEWSRPSGNNDNTKTSVTSIELNKETLELTAGETYQLTATVSPDNATDKTVTWTSDNTDAATVDASGLVTAVAMGTAIITAKAGDKTATCEVTVLPTLSTPLTVEAITAGTIIVTGPQAGMQYSLNGGAKKAVTTTPIDVAAGGKVAFYGNGISITKYNGTQIGGDGDGFKCKVYGNIMSLVDETDFATNYNTLPADYTFYNLFYGNAKLTDASGLLLPAMMLTNNCYDGMFQGCTSLTTAPKELPAMTLAEKCYSYMFHGCSSLTTAPKLPAETLAGYCYAHMFAVCKALTTAPKLPATTLAGNCYAYMFAECSQLTETPKLPATSASAGCCYEGMFGNCTSLTTAYVKAAKNANCNYMFYGCTNAVTCTLYTDGDWSSCTDISNWTKNAYPKE